MDEHHSGIKAAWIWLGHFADHVGMVASLFGAAGMIALAVSSASRGAVAVAAVGVYGVYALSVAAQRSHYRSLCPREISEAPVLDPQAAVTRRRRELLTWHSRRRRLVPAAVGVLFLGLWYLSPEAARTWVFALGFLWTAVMSSYLTYVGVVHRRLYPWCPHCRHGGRGHRGFIVPDPTSPPVPKPQPHTV